MLVNIEWLKNLVELDNVSTSDLVNAFNLHSVEVEGVSKVLNGSDLVVGKVIMCTDHPNSDHLHITKVDIKTEVLDIVCGASNIKEGLSVIVAKTGCVLPNNLVIKKSVIRGVESNGMICSLVELGLDKKYVAEDGIFYFKEEVEIGSNPLELLLLNDEVLDLYITPNRWDLLSMNGIANEVKAILDTKIKPLEFKLNCSEQKNNVTVKNESEGCIVYHARQIKNIKIAPSPQWLISRLIAFGIRPINNAVDITNYILAQFGQPLHAFDEAILGTNIVVRNAYQNEEMITLDEVKRVLNEDDIVITDGSKIVALGGVMGGLDSSITENTTDIILEAAIFNSTNIRKTSKRLNLTSEAQIRFEKGVDYSNVINALDYAAYLYQELCGASVMNGISSSNELVLEETKISISGDDLYNYLGIKVENIPSILTRLGFPFKSGLNTFSVTIPHRRKDLTIKADLIEEIARIYGYDHLNLTLPKTSSIGGLSFKQNIKRIIKNKLVNLGISEVITYSLKENNNNLFNSLLNTYDDIELLYPISIDKKVLRKELVSSLLEVISYSMNRKIKNNNIFEIGKIYYKENDFYSEHNNLCLVLSNDFIINQWNNQKLVVDFFLIKGIIDELFNEIGVSFNYTSAEINNMHPKRCASLSYNDLNVGFIGQIHPKFAHELEIDAVYVCELNLDLILENIDSKNVVYTKISKVPNVERDLSFVVSNDVSDKMIIDTVIKSNPKLIKDAYTFDLYVNESLGENVKSVAIRVIIGDYETLTEEVINNVMKKVMKNLEYHCKAVLRG